MDEKELLQAISGMMDQKLRPIQQDISGTKGNISGLKTWQKSIQYDVSSLKQDVSDLKTE